MWISRVIVRHPHALNWASALIHHLLLCVLFDVLLRSSDMSRRKSPSLHVDTAVDSSVHASVHVACTQEVRVSISVPRSARGQSLLNRVLLA